MGLAVKYGTDDSKKPSSTRGFKHGFKRACRVFEQAKLAIIEGDLASRGPSTLDRESRHAESMPGATRVRVDNFLVH